MTESCDQWFRHFEIMVTIHFPALGTDASTIEWGVSYNTKSASKCGHLQRDGGSINRLQMYIGDTNAN